MNTYNNTGKTIDDLFMDYIQSFKEILDEYGLGSDAAGLAVPISLCISDYAAGFAGFKQKRVIKNYQKSVYNCISQESIYSINSTKKVYEDIMTNPNYINKTDISIDEIVSYPGQRSFSHLGLFTVLSILDYNSKSVNQYTHNDLVNAVDSIVELSYLFYKKLMFASRNGGSVDEFNEHISFSSTEKGKVSRGKLEKELMTELKELAGVKYFPWEDAKEISTVLAAYTDGNSGKIGLALMMFINTLEKYPRLCSEWDSVMIKYHKKGLFPNWNIDSENENEADDDYEINRLNVVLKVGDKVRRKEDGSIGIIKDIHSDKVSVRFTDGPIKGHVKTVVKDAILDIDDGLYIPINEEEYNNHKLSFEKKDDNKPNHTEINTNEDLNTNFFPKDESESDYDDIIAETKPEEATDGVADDGIRFCFKCGSTLRPGAVFCERCGTRIR